jgi:hypothetical protein
MSNGTCVTLGLPLPAGLSPVADPFAQEPLVDLGPYSAFGIGGTPTAAVDTYIDMVVRDSAGAVTNFWDHLVITA